MRRKHYKVDDLPPELHEEVDEMIKNGAYYHDIVEYIKSKGGTVSKSSVGRYAKNLLKTIEALQASQENFRAILDEIECYPELDVTEGILRLLAYQLLIAANELTEEQLTGLDFEAIIKNTISLTKAIAYKKDIDTKNRTAYENGKREYTTAFYDTIKAENPKLYKELVSFMKQLNKKYNTA